MAITKDLKPLELEFLKFQKKKWLDAQTALKKLQIWRERGLFQQKSKEIEAKKSPSWFLKWVWVAADTLKESATAFVKWPIETVKWIAESTETTIKGSQWLGGKIWLVIWDKLRTLLGKPNLTEEQKKNAPFGWETTVSEDLLNIWEGSLWAWFTVVFPVTTVLLNTAAQTEWWRAALIPLTKAITKWWEFVNKAPLLRDFRESLPEEKRSDFDAFVWQLTTMWLSKWSAEILAKYRAAKVTKLTKEAETLVNEFIKPTKESSKTITKKITPEILERKIKWNREQVGEIATAGVEKSWKAIDKFIKEWKVKWEMPIDKLVEVLAKEDAALRFEGKILPGKESQVKFIDSTLSFLEQVQKKTWNKLTPEAQIQLKRSFDTVFDKAVTRDKITKFQDDLQVKLADTLRKELAQNNPAFDRLNKDFAFYKWLEKVMSETNRRTTGQAEIWLWGIISWQGRWLVWAWVWWTVGTSIWWPIWWIIWATIWWVLWNKLQGIISNPKWKLISANKKANLAKTLASWNKAKITTLLDSFAVSMNLNLNK